MKKSHNLNTHKGSKVNSVVQKSLYNGTIHANNFSKHTQSFAAAAAN